MPCAEFYMLCITLWCEGFLYLSGFFKKKMYLSFCAIMLVVPSRFSGKEISF